MLTQIKIEFIYSEEKKQLSEVLTAFKIKSYNHEIQPSCTRYFSQEGYMRDIFLSHCRPVNSFLLLSHIKGNFTKYNVRRSYTLQKSLCVTPLSSYSDRLSFHK